jgi:hypothetical protein
LTSPEGVSDKYSAEPGVSFAYTVRLTQARKKRVVEVGPA